MKGIIGDFKGCVLAVWNRIKNNAPNVELKSHVEFLNIISEEGGVNKGEIWLSGFVGDDWREDGVSMRNLKNYVTTNNLKKCDIMLSTGGGYVHSAMEIGSYMQMQKDVIFRVVNVGVVASAGTIILATADKAEAVVGSLTMIHDPLFENWGGMKAKDMRKGADVLDKLKNSIIGVYVAKMKKMDKEKVKNEEEVVRALGDMMEEETWMSADEAKALGLINNVIEGGKIKREKIEVTNNINNKILNSLNYKNMSKLEDFLKKTSGGGSNKTVEAKNEEAKSEVDKALALLKKEGFEVESEVDKEEEVLVESEVDKALALLKSKGYNVVSKKEEVVVDKKDKVVEVVNNEEGGKLAKMEALVLAMAEKVLSTEEGDKKEVKRVVKKMVTPVLNVAGNGDTDEIDEEKGGGKSKDVFIGMKNGKEIKAKMEALAGAFKG